MSLVSQGFPCAVKEEAEEIDVEKILVELCGEKTEFQKEQERAREAAIASHAGRSFFKELPPDVRDLLQKLPKWKTDEDFRFAISRYCSRRVQQNELKELSSVLAGKHKDSINVSEALAKSADDLYCELAEQVPDIKDMLEYESFFSQVQKLCIEKALAEKLQKEKQTTVNQIQDPHEAAIIRLKALHRKLLVMEDKICEERDRCVGLGRLCSLVNDFMEPKVRRPSVKMVRRWKDHAGKIHKRPKLVRPANEGWKLMESEDNKFYVVGGAEQIIRLYAGPNFFKQLPSDIRDLLQKFPKCETIEDLEITLSEHRNGLIEPECLPMDLQEQLKALKELSSALDCKYETCIYNIQELGMSSVVVYRELVEQFPGIKDMKEYGILFKGAQRNFVEKALEAKLREDKIVTVNRIPVPQGSPEIRLKDFQTKLLDNENKRSEESKRRRILVRLRSTVKYSTQNL